MGKTYIRFRLPLPRRLAHNRKPPFSKGSLHGKGFGSRLNYLPPAEKGCRIKVPEQEITRPRRQKGPLAVQRWTCQNPALNNSSSCFFAPKTKKIVTAIPANFSLTTRHRPRFSRAGSRPEKSIPHKHLFKCETCWETCVLTTPHSQER